jgi:hypothetical protein
MFCSNTGPGTIMKHYVVGVLCLAVAACMSGIPLPVPLPQAPPKLASEVMNADALAPRDGTGVIIVTREKLLRGKSCTYDIALDGKLVAGLRTGEQVTLYADPGARIVDVSRRKDSSCAPAIAQVPVQVVASATTKIKVGADISYDLKVEATTF